MNIYQRFFQWATLIFVFWGPNIRLSAASSEGRSNVTKFTSHGQEQAVFQSLPSTFDIENIEFEGWDMNSKTDLDLIARVKEGFKDAMALAWYADESSTSIDQAIFQRYFGSDKKSVTPSVVFSIFNNIHGAAKDKTKGNEILKKIKIRKTVKDSDADVDRCKLESSTLAFMRWTGNDKIGFTAYIVLCKKFWDLPDFVQSKDKCDKAGTAASKKMDTFGRGLLHEFLHFPEVSMGFHGILDDIHVDPDYNRNCYGPKNTQWLADNYPEKAALNADNFAWFAEESRWSKICNKKFEAIDTSQNSCEVF